MFIVSREVKWTRSKYELVCYHGMLSEEDCQILEEHIKQMTNLQISRLHNVNEGVIIETIGRLKQVYDEVQREFPDLLDKREKDVYHKKKQKKSIVIS